MPRFLIFGVQKAALGSGFFYERRLGVVGNLATRYSARAHALLVGWNSLAAAYVGSADFRNAVSALAKNLHIPLWTLALFTGLVNLTVSYRNWERQK